MRILVITNMYPSPEFPADGIFVKRQIDALERRYGDLEMQICYLDTIRNKTAYITGAWDVFSAMRRFRPDIVHIHYGLTQLMCWPISGVPVVVTLHGSDLTIPWQRAITLYMLRRSWRVVIVSGKLRSLMSSRDDAAVISCGVDAARFDLDRAQARKDLGIGDDEDVILFGSNPNRAVKRYDRFLESTQKLTGRLACARLVRLSDVSIADVPKLISASDVLVLTSDREGSPIVTKEALCSAVRVVSTPVGDVDDQLRGFSGCRISGWASDDIAGSIGSVLNEERPDRRLAAERFDHARECSELLSVYRSMIRV